MDYYSYLADIDPSIIVGIAASEDLLEIYVNGSTWSQGESQQEGCQPRFSHRLSLP